VGQKKPLSDLVTEYAQADQAFVVKTQVWSRLRAQVDLTAFRRSRLPILHTDQSRETDNVDGEVRQHDPVKSGVNS
jgi:hypothetical protein